MAGGTFGGGNGTSATPYLCTDAADLNAIRNNLTAYYKLANNIDLNVAPYNTGAGWVPIGTAATPFYGVIDGANFTISNLFINTPTVDNVGFIGIASSATAGCDIGNIVLTNVNVTGRSFVGALVGDGYPRAVVHHISADGVVKGDTYVGGMISRGYQANSITSAINVSGTSNVAGVIVSAYGGYHDGSTGDAFTYPAVYDNSVTGNVTGTGTGNVSGVVCSITFGYKYTPYDRGYSYGLLRNNTYNGTVTNSGGATAGICCSIGQNSSTPNLGATNPIHDNVSKGRISIPAAVNGGVMYIGGVYGSGLNSSLPAQDTGGSYSTMDIDVVGSKSIDYIGGFAGIAVNINKAYASGKVTTDGEAYIGGFAGKAQGCTQCSSHGVVTAGATALNGSAGGFVGYMDNSTISDCYTKSNVNAPNMTYTGGFVGQFSPTSTGYYIRTSYAANKVVGKTPKGFIGYGLSQYFTLTNCFFDSEYSALTDGSVGVTGATTAQMKTQATYVGYDFTATTGIWNITAGSSYAFLMWQTSDVVLPPSSYVAAPSGVLHYVMGKYTYYNDSTWVDSVLTCFSITGVPTYAVTDSNAVYTEVDNINDWFGYRVLAFGMNHDIQKYKYNDVAKTWSLDGAVYTADSIKLKLYSGYKTDAVEVAATPLPVVDVANTATYPIPPARFAKGKANETLPWVMYYPVGVGEPYSNLLHMAVLFKLQVGSTDKDIRWKRMAQDAKHDAIQFKDDISKVDAFIYMYDITSGFWKNLTRQTPGVPSYADFGITKVDSWTGNPFLYLGGAPGGVPSTPTSPPATTPAGSPNGGAYVPPSAPTGDGSTIPVGAISYQLKIVTPQGIRTIPIVDTNYGGLVISLPKDGKKYIPIL